MTARNLEKMLSPNSLVLVGASSAPSSVGFKIAQNLLDGGFEGPLRLVNPKYDELLGRPCFRSISSLPEVPDLAVVAVPPDAVPGVIDELAAHGTKAAVVITANLGNGRQAMLDAARPQCLRLLGPNCLGLMLPPIGVNATFAHRAASAGGLAFVSQSGALMTTVIDWSLSRSIGFSHMISVGEMADIDFGDLLDHLAGDPQCRAVLMYIEAVTDARKFVSAARRAARVKPVIVVKSGRHDGGAKAAFSHTGALAGFDAAYDAAFRRTGVLRVKTLDELFAAAEMLSHAPRLAGDRLAILSNGGGAGVMASDELQDAEGELAALGPETVARLNPALPAGWSHANPVDIIGDANADRFARALDVLLDDEQSDAVFVVACPTAMLESEAAAQAVVTTCHSKPQKPVLTAWLGGDGQRAALDLFESARIPSFQSIAEGITGFMQLVRHRRAQAELMRAPPADRLRAPNRQRVADLIASALKDQRTRLNAIEAADVLDAYEIPVLKPRLVESIDDLADVADRLLAEHAACVLKVVSPQITHKTDVGGVRLGLDTAMAVVEAAHGMAARVAKERPDATLSGFTLEPMIVRPKAFETIVGVTLDPTFGPMVLFGAGGTAVEILNDRALGLPPLDAILARQMIDETRIAKLLSGYRGQARAKIECIVDVLVSVSELVIHHPEIAELDINPLLVDADGAIAIDARIRIADQTIAPRQPLAIRPYPTNWERAVGFEDMGTLLIRPVRPEDGPMYETFFGKLEPEDIRLRFFSSRRTFTREFVAGLTQIDYAREMAFAAISANGQELLGEARLILSSDRDKGEFGVLVRSDLHGRGLGGHLMRILIDYARGERVRSISGIVLSQNSTMLRMASELGFTSRFVSEDPTATEIELALG
ncbi:MAG: bifunctional acetate--CoA ligase family protein/GNAT family N-acetyltransferase [Hyphomicrobium sp.]|nr:bifunctional acetate--CoA ligase family protein/GNAT family N-acetyltransferase [Hyphomicrobium sp.]